MIHFKLPIKVKNKEQTNIKFLSLGIDKRLDLKVNTEQIIYHFTYADTLKIMYFLYFHFIIKYVIIFWGKSADKKVSFHYRL
jgi:hypothetical protein